MVVSAAIAKYVHVIINSIPGQSIEITSSDFQLHYSQLTDTPLPQEGELKLVYQILEEFGFRSGVSVFIASEVPPGTGLGSSGSVAVALIKALATASGRRMSPMQIAELACEIEIEKLGSKVGKQDQYASSFGGVNRMRFTPDKVDVQPMNLDHRKLQKLSANLMLFFTGRSHSASAILKKQTQSVQAGDTRVTSSLEFIRNQADEAVKIISSPNTDELGELMHQGWLAKKNLSNAITTPFIDECYEDARQAGAIGGKITGAGGGGFMLLYARPDDQLKIAEKMSERGLTPMRCDFDSSGATVIINSGIPLNDVR